MTCIIAFVLIVFENNIYCGTGIHMKGVRSKRDKRRYSEIRIYLFIFFISPKLHLLFE